MNGKRKLSKNKKKSKPTRDKSKDVHLIYVRNIGDRENQMLTQLRALPGYKTSNASNVMKASNDFLKLKEEMKQVMALNAKLKRDNEMKDDKYSEIKEGLKRLIESQEKEEKQMAKKRKEFVSILKRAGNKIPKPLRQTYSYYNQNDDDDDN
jgi:hypothetical protein